MSNALWTVLLLSAPALLAAIVIGFGIGLLQALTQIQDQSLPQAVKVIVIMLVLIVGGPLLVGQLVNLTDQVLDNFAVWSR
nr:flagellar biosynthetic protein FliQ [Halomonas zhangzhouensis]